jgi:hypothetical protein
VRGRVLAETVSSRGLGVAVLLCVVLVLAGCRSDQLDDLASDPIVSATPEGGSLVRSREDEAEGGGLLGKPSPTQVLRTYAFESEAAARRAMTELRMEAEDVGWEIDVVAPDGSGFSGSRSLDGRPVTLIVALNVDPAFPPAPGVFIRLTSPQD